jgi:hypothetical protein
VHKVFGISNISKLIMPGTQLSVPLEMDSHVFGLFFA